MRNFEIQNSTLSTVISGVKKYCIIQANRSTKITTQIKLFVDLEEHRDISKMDESSKSTSRTSMLSRNPKTMPTFSMDNPLHAVYLKRKGVERLLNRNVGSTLSAEFVNETRKKIELNERTTAAFRTDDDDDDDDEVEQRQDNHTKDFPSLLYASSDDSSSSIDWSLPGGEEEIDTRYGYDDDDDESERRRRIRKLIRKNKKNQNNIRNNIRKTDNSSIIEERDQQQQHRRIESFDTFEVIIQHASWTCHQEDRVTFKNWGSCF
ncbi:MAG: hypothetical protein ACI8RD_007344 [Bacillariaceae sp.]